MSLSSAVFIACAAIDATVGLTVLFAGGKGRADPRSRITLPRAALAAFAVAAAFAIKLVPLRALGLSGFGLIHLAYLDLVVVLPGIGIAVLIASRLPHRVPGARRLAPSVLGLAVLSLAGVPAAWYATFICPFDLRIEEARIALQRSRAGREPLRIAVLADIQTDRVTDYEREAIRRALALAPDLILIPGDVFQGSHEVLERELPALRELFGQLTAPGGVLMVPGNTDSVEGLSRMIEGTEVELLANSSRRLRVRDWQLTVLGLELWPTEEYTSTIRALEEAPGEDDVRIVLAHYPDAVLRLRPDSRIDLVVAGHTHGGQVQLPFFGPPITLSRVPRRIAAGGLHEHEGNRIYVSRGVGWEREQAPRIRFLCPPEVSLLELVAARE